jgi:ABC-type arginine transport system ATPase subunit
MAKMERLIISVYDTRTLVLDFEDREKAVDVIKDIQDAAIDKVTVKWVRK